MDAVVVNEYTLHLEVCLFTVFLVLKLNKGILETIASTLVPDDFAGQYLAKATEDQF
jgi:hypothetical protein